MVYVIFWKLRLVVSLGDDVYGIKFCWCYVSLSWIGGSMIWEYVMRMWILVLRHLYSKISKPCGLKLLFRISRLLWVKIDVFYYGKKLKTLGEVLPKFWENNGDYDLSWVIRLILYLHNGTVTSQIEVPKKICSWITCMWFGEWIGRSCGGCREPLRIRKCIFIKWF